MYLYITKEEKNSNNSQGKKREVKEHQRLKKWALQ